MATEIPEELKDDGLLATRTGYVPDTPDQRDALYIDTLYKEIATTGVHLQAQHLQSASPGVYNQLNLGSCVANAVAMALRYGQHKTVGMTNDTTFNPSRLFIWYFAKFLAGEDAKRNDPTKPGGEEAAKFNAGSQIRNALKTVYRYGVCPEEKWPYPTTDVNLVGSTIPQQLPSDIAKPPSQELLELAKNYCNFKLRYYRIMTVAENTNEAQADSTKAPTATAPSKVEQIRSCLAEGYPVVFAIKVFQKQNPDTGAWQDSWNPTNWKNMNRASSSGSNEWFVKEAPADEDLGQWKSGHAMLIVGYHRDLRSGKDGKPGMFRIQNSWGDANLPYIWLPYSYFERGLVHDTWVIKIDGLLNAPDDKRDKWDAQNDEQKTEQQGEQKTEQQDEQKTEQ